MTTIQCPECETWCFHPFEKHERGIGEDFICPGCHCEFTMRVELFITKHGYKVEGR